MMEVRQVDEKDEEGIRDLFCTCFGRQLTHDEWVWKYKASPWGSTAVVGVDDGRVVAHYGGIRLQFRFGTRTVTAFQFCDVMTHPAYRGRVVGKSPIIVRAGELFYQKNPMDFAFGFPSLRHARLQSVRLGGEGYRLIQTYKKDSLRSHFRFWKATVREGWELLDRGELSGLRGKDDGQVRLAKTEKYILWRYINNPTRKYGLLVIRKMGRTTGHVIFARVQDQLRLLELFRRKDEDVREILFALENHVVERMEGVHSIRMWLHPMEPVRCHLDSLGYVREADDIPVAFKMVDTGCGVTSKIFYDRYFYSMGDYDAA